MKTFLKDIELDKEVEVSGFVEVIRDQKTMLFVVIKDSSGMLQVAISKKGQPEIFEEAKKLTKYSVVSFTGKKVSAPMVSLGGVEFIPTGMEIESIAETSPVDEETGIDQRLDYRWIDLRGDKQRLIFKIRTFIERVMREFFIEKGFIEIHTPKISAIASEGGAEVFKFDYYGTKAFLTQSPQLYKQMAIASGFDRVFEIGAQYRAEKSFTPRHASESVAFDFEIAYIKSHHELMDLEEEWLIYVLSKVKEEYGEEIKEVFKTEVKVPVKMPRIKLAEVFEIFEKEYGVVIPKGGRYDLDTEGEKLISRYAEEKLGSEFVFITDYPSKSRAFYSKMIEGSKECMAFDLLYRGWEMNSGAVREHRYEVLSQQIQEHGIKPEKMQEYLDFFKYGCPPHGGIGFGIDRFVAKLLGLKSIKESVFVFRGPSRIKP